MSSFASAFLLHKLKFRHSIMRAPIKSHTEHRLAVRPLRRVVTPLAMAFSYAAPLVGMQLTGRFPRITAFSVGPGENISLIVRVLLCLHSYQSTIAPLRPRSSVHVERCRNRPAGYPLKDASSPSLTPAPSIPAAVPSSIYPGNSARLRPPQADTAWRDVAQRGARTTLVARPAAEVSGPSAPPPAPLTPGL